MHGDSRFDHHAIATIILNPTLVGFPAQSAEHVTRMGCGRHKISVPFLTGSVKSHVHPIFTTATAGAEDQEVRAGHRQPPAPFGRVPAFFCAFQCNTTHQRAVGGTRGCPGRRVELQDNVAFAAIGLVYGHPLTRSRSDGEAVAVAAGEAAG